MKDVQCHMCTVKGHMTRVVHFLFAPREEDDSENVIKEEVKKYVNFKIRQRFLAHIMFKVCTVDICICKYSTLFNVIRELSGNNSDRWE